MACIFCRIVAGEAPATVIYKDDLVTVIRDLRPQAPLHVLVIPNEHIPSAADVDESHGALLGHMLVAARRVATQEGVAASGYRLVFNVGRGAGQSVDHLHLHVLGGRRLSWPPG